jgi:hypothetical protein
MLGQGQVAMGSITQVAEHLKSVSAKIDSGNGTVGALVNDRALYDNLDKTASGARTAVTSADAGIKDFRDNMEALKHNFLLKGYVAVIQVSTGKTGNSSAALTLAQGRAMVVRDYIVQHYGFDDTKLKTFSLGKQADETSKADWGEIKILIYPAGTPIPADKTPNQAPAAASTSPAH